MRKLRLYMVVFFVLLTLPLAFVAWRTYGALDREAQAQVRFFSERLLDEIEAELTDLVRREENRAVDEYRHTLVQEGGNIQSPLNRAPVETFILGYFQNNPDGSFQTPLVTDTGGVPAGLADRVQKLQAINAIFNQRKFVGQQPAPAPATIQKSATIVKKEPSSFAGRFLRTSERKKAKSVLGQEQARVEEITVDQAMNLAQKELDMSVPLRENGAAVDMEQDEAAPLAYGMRTAPAIQSAPAPLQRQMAGKAPGLSDTGRFHVEVAPLQAVAIDDGRVFIFRRIGINGQIYRQGFVLQLQPFLDHLLAVHYDPQPIARYTRLTLNAAGLSKPRDRTGAAAGITVGDWVAGRTFPAPFGFLSAEMRALGLPPSPARQTLTLALAILSVVMVAGLVTIYYSTRTVLDLSERRSQFVSAVTHELKTPLTNIRMYIEMLDQGIAATPEREQEYFGILASESARLSGLINNVLELSRLEKQTRRFDLKDGDLTDVLADVQSVMAESLAREGFDLTILTGQLPVFAYDREVLVQVLINLMENSIKFGRHLTEKHIVIAADAVDSWVKLTVSDTGPGIPKRSLKQVFDDFYRVDNDLARTTGGTGIGLALVKKFLIITDFGEDSDTLPRKPKCKDYVASYHDT
ncbi:MAG: HAMP domain-containing histidine kinase [Desulfosarcina sp.]|nr:HAMP domain-containing histidine kinase [Desulfosarcina sp.]MBC2741916.1 HAMP domain-containing histidine kinase [Desulfosarcina sp.]MBC2764829.1 HAMP domain-containing histidine kinase [Desulfosarcina sp.]